MKEELLQERVRVKVNPVVDDTTPRFRKNSSVCGPRKLQLG